GPHGRGLRVQGQRAPDARAEDRGPQGAARPDALDNARGCSFNDPGAERQRSSIPVPALERPRSGAFCLYGPPMTRIFIYDTTLRDGSQGEGVNFSLMDKLNLTTRLDELGIDFIEGGYPLSNPKDFEYFQQVQKLSLGHARVAAFGMTRRKGVAAADDTCIKALLDSQAPLITIVGKTWDLHVRDVLNTTLEENLG